MAVPLLDEVCGQSRSGTLWRYKPQKSSLREILCAGIWILYKKLSLVFSNLYWLLLPNRNGVVKPSSGYGEGEIMA